MFRLKKMQRTIYLLLFLCFIACMSLGIFIISKEDSSNGNKRRDTQPWLDTKISKDKERFGLGGSQLLQKLRKDPDYENIPNYKHQNKAPDKNKTILGVLQAVKMSNSVNVVKKESKPSEFNSLNYNVHMFYYMWYGNPTMDGRYMHWNHMRLPHWDPVEAQKWSKDRHIPPDDIGSNFYPELGPYSSQDPHVMEEHMKQITSSGAGVLAVSWYPPDQADDNGKPWDQYMPLLMNTANQYNLKVCFHIEPLKDRSPATMKKWIKYIIDAYGTHPAFYRYKHKDRMLPLYYIYDSYQVNPATWAQLLKPGGTHSIRGTEYDGVFIGLIVDSKHRTDIFSSGFDGFYTYFASTGFTYGSTSTNWNRISRDAKKSNLLFIPSVGPGYVDDRVRPWNKRNTKSRDNGKYYEHMFKLAVECNPPIITITSFNEWHEGTQVESAISKVVNGYKYDDYSPNGAGYYLNLTNKYVGKFTRLKTTGLMD